MTSNSNTSTASDFYYACRNGLMDQIRQQLPKLTLEEIDKIEGNGSTGLHAACYYGHIEIVKLLLDRGASRSVYNKHKCLPYDEAETEEIKKLFRRPSTNRFSNDGLDYIDWMKCDTIAEALASDYRFRHIGFGWKSKHVDHRIKYIKDELSHTENDRISTFLNQMQIDPSYLLKAYTVESDFYIKLNRDLATKHFDQGTNFGITYFIDFFYNNPTYENLSFKGKVYRSIYMTHDDLKQYSVGGKIMNRTFMSTTKDRKIAEDFTTRAANNHEKQYGKLSAFCTYQIINNRTGLNLEGISEYRNEKEVLIGPYATFKITTIRQISPNYVEVHLRECEKGIDDDEGEEEDDDDWK